MKISNSKSSLQISFAFEKCFYRIGLGFYLLLPCLSPNDEVLKFPRSVSAVKLLSACHFCEDSVSHCSSLTNPESWTESTFMICAGLMSAPTTVGTDPGLQAGGCQEEPGPGEVEVPSWETAPLGEEGAPRPALLKFSMSWRWEASLRWGPGSVTGSLEKGSTIATRARDKWRPFHSVQNAIFKS